MSGAGPYGYPPGGPMWHPVPSLPPPPVPLWTRPRGIWTGGRIVLLAAAGLVDLLLTASLAIGPSVVAVAQEAGTTLATPSEAGGFTKGGETAVLQRLQRIRRQLEDAGIRDPVTAYYCAASPIVVYGGQLVHLWLSVAMAEFYQGVASEPGTVRGRTSVDPGDLGGAMDCAYLELDAQRFAVCSWLNHGALLAMVSPRRSIGNLAPVTRRMLPDLVSLP